MTTPLPNQIIREITPLSDKDCFYIAERYKTEFTYPIHNHSEFELNFTEKAAGVRRVVGDSSEVIGDYDLVLITGKDLEHVWEQNECRSKEIREITIQFSSDLQELTCMVRQLQPTETGIPLELYFFSANKVWVAYEGIQADVFDHVLAIIPEFDLQVFQNPSGADLCRIGVKIEK